MAAPELDGEDAGFLNRFLGTSRKQILAIAGT